MHASISAIHKMANFRQLALTALLLHALTHFPHYLRAVQTVVFIYLSWKDNRTAGIIHANTDAINSANYSFITPCSLNQKVQSEV